MNSDNGSHLSVVIDLSPSQWHLSAQLDPTNSFPLPLHAFLSQLFAFFNAHIASKHENSLAVFGALPGKRFAFLEMSQPCL
jgi:RNA polymerase II transcription initiation/nucleotide excision repair factor TFIIH, subunit TFB4